MANGALRLIVQPTTEAPMQALPANSLRNYLLIQNVGTAPVAIGFDMTITPAAGLVLAPMGSIAPGQRAPLSSSSSGSGLIPSNAIWAVSGQASTLAIVEG